MPLLVTAASIVAVLIHEAAYVAVVPAVYSYWYLRNRQGRIAQRSLVLSVLALTFVWLMLGSFGNASQSVEAHMQELTGRLGPSVDLNAVAVLHRSLADSSEMALSRLNPATWTAIHLLLLAGLMPTFYLFLQVSAAAYNTGDDGRVACVVLASAFAPVVLYAAGHDFGRWWSFIVVNLFAVTWALVGSSSAIERSVFDALSKRMGSVLVIASFSFILGPIGIDGGHSRLQRIGIELLGL